MSQLAKIRAALLASILILSSPIISSRAAEEAVPQTATKEQQQEFVSSVFQKGKEFYDNNRYQEALDEWAKIDPFLDDNPSVKKVVVFLRKQISKKGISTPTAAAKPAPAPKEQTVTSTPIVRSAPVSRPSSVSASPSASPASSPEKVITQASQEISERVAQVRETRAASQSTAQDHQRMVEAAFQKGKQAYDQGRMDEAIKEWDKLSDEPGFSESIRQLKQNYTELIKQNAQAHSASLDQSSSTQEFSSFLNKASQRFQAESSQLSARTKAAQDQSTNSKEAVRAAFDKASLLYSQGKYNQAIDEWKKVLPVVGEDSELGQRILSVEAGYQEMLQAKQASDEIQNSQKADISAKDYAGQIEKASHELAEKAQEAKKKRIEMQTTVTQRREVLRAAFEKGKEAYEQGHTEEAISEWDKLSTEPEFQNAVMELKQNFTQLAQQNASLKAASLQEAGLSGEVSTFLAKASARFESEAAQVSARTKDLNERVERNQNLITNVFQQGRTSYYQGRYVQAIEEWKRLIPVVGEDSDIARQISELESRYQDIQQAKQSGAEIEKTQSLTALSPEYENELRKATQQMAAKAREMKEKNIQNQMASKQNQEMAMRAFQKGKAAYDAGHVDEAIKEWEILGDDPDLEAVIKALKQNAKDLSEANLQLQSVSSGQGESMKPIMDFLTKTNERLSAQSSSSKARYKEEKDKLVKGQSVIQDSFEKGKLLYYQGKYGEAVNAWKAVLPYVGADSPIGQQIISLQTNLSEMEEAKSATEETEKSRRGALQIPEEYSAELNKANQDLSVKAADFKKKRIAAELSAKQRQENIDTAFQKGKILYDQGRFEEAMKEWEKLSDEPDFQGTLASLRANMRDMEDASAAMKGIAMDQVGLSQPLTDFFKKANQRFQAEAEETTKRLEANRQKISKTGDVVANAFQQGKLLYFQGKYAQAVDEWSAVLPTVGENSEIGRQILDLEASYQKLLSAKQEAEDYQQKQGEYKMPPDLAKQLADMNEGLKSKAQEAKQKRADLEASFKQKELTVESAFVKGKALFNDGRYEEAVAKWDSIRDITPVSSQFDALLANAHDILKMKTEADQALSSQRSLLKVPVSELEGLLSKANDNLKAQIQAKKAKASEEYRQQQDNINTLFQQGKNYYDDGDMERAAAEWSKLLPYAEKGSSFETALTEFRNTNQQALDAKRALSEASAAKPQLDAQTVSALSRMMQDAQEKTFREIDDVKKQSLETNRAVSDRQKWINATFASGKALYEQGKYYEALTEWDKITVYVEDKADARQALQKLREDLKQALEAKKQAMEAMSLENAKLKTPEEFTTYLSQVSATLKSQTQESLDAMSKAEASLSERQAAFDAAFDKGKTLFTQRKYEEAAAAWNSLIPYLQDKATADEIQALSGEMTKASAARAQARQTQIRLEAKYEAPKELSGLLKDAQQALSVQTQEATLARSKAEQSLAERQQWIQDTTDKAKSYLAQKQYDEAAAQLKALAPYLDDKAVSAELDNLVKSMETLRAARAQADEISKRAQSKMTSPKELPKLLSQAQEGLKARTQEALDAKSKAEASITERQQWIAATFEKGKSLFANKQYEEAAKTWSAIAPFLPANDPSASAITQVQASVDNFNKANADLKDALARQGGKFSAPADLSALLVKFSQDLRPQIDDAMKAKAKADQSLSERQQWIVSTFEKGRDFYKQSKYGEGIDEWSKLVPYLDEKSGIREQIATLKQSYDDLLAARKEAVQAAANEYKGLQLPSDFGNAFEDAVAALKQEMVKSADDKKKAESSLEARRQELSETFQKGQDYFSHGDFENAVKTWNSLTSYLDENSQGRQYLDAVKAAYAELSARQAELKDIQKRQSQKAVLAAAETKMLADANQSFTTQTKETLIQKTKADQLLSERQKNIEATLQKAQTLFSDGKVDQAVELWNTLLPQLDPSSDAAKLINEIKTSFLKAQDARKQLSDSVARQDMKLGLSQQRTDFLAGVSHDIQVQTTDALSQKSKADQVLSERQKYVETTLQKAQTLFNDGKVDQAVELWNTLLPQLDPSSDAAKAINEVKESFSRAQDARKQLSDAVTRQEQKLSLPAEQVKFLNGANQDFMQQTQAALAEKAKQEEELAKKEKWALDTYNQAKILYEKGQYAEAIEQWEKIIPYLGEASDGARQILGAMKTNYDQSVKAKKAASEFALNEYSNLKAPYGAEMAKLLSDGNDRLMKQTQEAAAQRADMEKSFNDRQAWIASTFAKGKEFIAKGQYKEAIDVWSTLLPYLENADAVSGLLKSVDTESINAAKAKAALEQAASKQGDKFETPDELPKLLNQAAAGLKTETSNALAQKGQLDQAAMDRQKWLKETLEKGKQLYNQGQYEDAIHVWETMVLYLENGQDIKALIQQTETNYQEALAAKNVLSQAVAKKDQKFPAPPELSKLLMQTAQDLKLQLQESQGARSRAEQSVAERQAWLTSTFAKGKELYDQGKFNQAVTLWEGMMAYLDDSPEIRGLMEEVSKNFDEAEQAKLDAQQALSKQEIKLKTPEDLVTLLSKAVEDLRDQTRSAKAKSVDLEKSRIERQQWIDATFKDGKLYYDNAEYEKAAATWEPLLPYLNEERTMRGLIQTLRDNSANVMKAKQEANDYKNKTDIRFDLPADVPAMASDAIQRLNREILDAQQEKTRAEQSLRERQQWVINTFQEGKLYYDQKQYREALEQWEKLTPFVDEKTGFKQLVDTVRQAYKESLEAKRGAVEAVANEYKGLKLAYADEMIMLLNEADKRLKAEAAEAGQKRDTLEKSLAERREWIVNTFNKGKIAYDQGEFQEAVEQWDRLLPYLEPNSDMKRTIESIKDNYTAMMTSKQAVKQSSGDRPVELDSAVVGQATALFQEANERFKSDAAQAKAQLADVQQILNQRRSSFEQVYQKGKSLYDQGKYNEAFMEWERLTPFLDQLPDLKKLVEEAKKNYNDQYQTRQKLDESNQIKDTLKPLPALNNAAPVAYGNLMQSPAAPAAATPSPAAEPQKPALTSFEKKDEKSEESAPESAESDETAGLKFVSGEITDVSAEKKTVTLKLYSGAKKDLTLSFDESTQITGADEGKPGFAMKAGAAADVRYNPDANKATYIYIYS